MVYSIERKSATSFDEKNYAVIFFNFFWRSKHNAHKPIFEKVLKNFEDLKSILDILKCPFSIFQKTFQTQFFFM